MEDLDKAPRRPKTKSALLKKTIRGVAQLGKPAAH